MEIKSINPGPGLQGEDINFLRLLQEEPHTEWLKQQFGGDASQFGRLEIYEEGVDRAFSLRGL